MPNRRRPQAVPLVVLAEVLWHELSPDEQQALARAARNVTAHAARGLDRLARTSPAAGRAVRTGVRVAVATLRATFG